MFRVTTSCINLQYVSICFGFLEIQFHRTCHRQNHHEFHSNLHYHAHSTMLLFLASFCGVWKMPKKQRRKMMAIEEVHPSRISTVLLFFVTRIRVRKFSGTNLKSNFAGFRYAHLKKLVNCNIGHTTALGTMTIKARNNQKLLSTNNLGPHQVLNQKEIISLHQFPILSQKACMGRIVNGSSIWVANSSIPKRNRLMTDVVGIIARWFQELAKAS